MVVQRHVPACSHERLSLLNPWELLRKYVCEDCSAVLTCACSRDIATFVLPHQARRGVDPVTRDDVEVTDPLVGGVCFDCRGITPPAHPKAPHRGSASLIHRYYWHELWTLTESGFLEWCRAQGLPLLDRDQRPMVKEHRRRHPEEFDRISDDVLTRVRECHATTPRYDTTRRSDAEILSASGVQIVQLDAAFLTPNPDRKAMVLPVGTTDTSMAVSVEDFAARHYRDHGRQTLALESRPFQCLFGALMWMWVCDVRDERSQVAYFGGRDEVGADPDGLIAVMLPADFGSANHAVRRADALNEHLDFLPNQTDEMLWAYDYWLEPSRPLRQYLWAYSEADETRGRVLIDVLGARRVKDVLRFLASNYWERYLGWPDLMTWRDGAESGMADATGRNVLLVEVKSSGDGLSEDQRTWIESNAAELRLPFEVAKVHRAERVRWQ